LHESSERSLHEPYDRAPQPFDRAQPPHERFDERAWREQHQVPRGPPPPFAPFPSGGGAEDGSRAWGAGDDARARWPDGARARGHDDDGRAPWPEGPPLYADGATPALPLSAAPPPPPRAPPRLLPAETAYAECLLRVRLALDSVAASVAIRDALQPREA
jgi:hypothetical protein